MSHSPSLTPTRAFAVQVSSYAVFGGGALRDLNPLYSEKYDSVPLRMLSSLCGVGFDSSMPCVATQDGGHDKSAAAVGIVTDPDRRLPLLHACPDVARCWLLVSASNRWVTLFCNTPFRSWQPAHCNGDDCAMTHRTASGATQ